LTAPAHKPYHKDRPTRTTGGSLETRGRPANGNRAATAAL